MALSRKVKLALDETRILILGAQILLGFQLQGAFRPVQDQLPAHDHGLEVASLLIGSLTVGLLIAPSLQHRIVERGHSTRRILRAIGRFASLALAPLAATLGLDVLMAVERVAGLRIGLLAGLACTGLAALFWYGLELVMKRNTGGKERAMSDREPEREHTPIEAKLEQMLTESRVLLPGAQALLGFQLAITFTESFEKLPTSSKLVHMAALALIALTVIFLAAPAAYHRIVYQGEDSQEMHDIGSRFIVAASGSLALGLATDLYVVVAKILSSPPAGIAAGGAAFVVLVALWHVLPLALRARQEHCSPTGPRDRHA